MDDARVPSTEQLMAEIGWVRQLARALVKDDATADDVAQDAWLVAAEQQPDADRPLRPWLSRVVTNLVRTRRRSDARRGERDAAYDAERPVPTPAELIERVELQRALADELLALAEPYRTTVLLHFVEGYSSAEIARRLGIPDGTVRRRLKVALDQLREALRKRTDQPQRGWLAALIPFARVPTPAAIGVIAMKKVIVIVALVLLVLLLVIGGVVLSRRDSRPTEAAGGAPASGAAPLHARWATDPSGRAIIPAWLTREGVPPRRIAGRVVSRGTPIAGAKVSLGFDIIGEPGYVIVMPGSESKALQPIMEVTSAADGSFDFGVQPSAAFTVSASAASYAPASVPVANGDPRAKTEQLVVELGACKTRLYGTIADASGGGIAKARISASGLSGTESDASGAYSLCVTPRRAVGTPSAEVRFEADGYGTIRQDVLVSGDLKHDVLLVPEAALAGKVAGSDGQAIAGAQVIAVPNPSNPQATAGWAITDREGRFRITGLAPGAFDLTASAQSRRTTSPIPAVATPTTTSREITLVVAALARVSGHVFMNDAPLAGATITAVQQLSLEGRSTLSAADGSFVVEVPFGATKFIAPPYRVEQQSEVEVARANVDGVRLDVVPMASLRGRVIRQGKPVADANVMYMAAPQVLFYGPQPAARTDATGAYVLEGVPAGPGRLFAWDDPSKSFSDWMPLDVAPTETKSIDIELVNWGEVKGTVVDEAGAVLPGVYVRMEIVNDGNDMCESITDSKGQFDCSMLTGGDYRPTVAPLPGGRQGFAPARGDHFDLVTVPKAGVLTGVTLAVKNERVAIRGTVVDDTGALVPDVRIEAIGRGDASMSPPSAMSDAQGRFEIGNLARGSYNLRATSSDGSETEQRDVVAGTDAVKVELARAGAIEGTLVGFSTKAGVLALPLERGRRSGGWAIVDGTTFSKTLLSPGRYTVEARAGAEVDAQIVEVRPGETTRVTLRSRGVGRVEGTVLELATQKPIAGMRCDALVATDNQASPAPPDASLQAFTDAAGHFATRAPIGRVRIFCFSPNGGEPLSPAGTDVDVTATTSPKLNLFAVRATFGNSPGDAGFLIAPALSPPTVEVVLPNGPAAVAGLLAGDHVVSIDGTSLQGVLPPGAMVLVMNHKPGSTVTLGIERGGAQRTIKIPVRAIQP